MFYRATDDGAGSGLGLYIVKEAIDKLQGSIHIDSEVGRGTIVMFEIPEIEKLYLHESINSKGENFFSPQLQLIS